MTVQEAIDWLKVASAPFHNKDKRTEAINMAIECIVEVEQYREIGLTPARIYEKIGALDVELGKYACIGTVEEVTNQKHNLSVAYKVIEELQQKDWIPCEERLLEDDDEEYYPMCLVTLDNGEVCTGVYRTDDKVWYTRMCEGETVYTKEHKVLAWQLLPQPYEKEGAE